MYPASHAEEATVRRKRPETQTFYFDWTDRFAGGAVGSAAVVGLSIILWAFWNQPGGVLASKLMGVAGVLFMLFGTIGGSLRMTSIQLSETGVRRLLFGRTWREILWQDAKQIRVMQAAPVANIGGPPLRQYFIEATIGWHIPYAPKGPIFFSSKILEHDRLLELLNFYIDRHSVPIIDIRPGADGKRLDRL